MMKHFGCVLLMLVTSIFVYGQDSGSLKFLGIPVDGPKTQFTTKLKTKGFTYNPSSECYTGQFNGTNVNLFVHTNHDLVDRVYISFPSTRDEEDIKNEYNLLLSQMKDTGKYMDLSFNERIPANEDIYHEISVNKKRYQASFCYFDPTRDPLSMVDDLMKKFSGIMPDDVLAKMTEFVKVSINLPDEEVIAMSEELTLELQALGFNADANKEKIYLYLETFFDGMKSIADGYVWFMIHYNYGRYNLGLYYDNLHNRAHGEDL